MTDTTNTQAPVTRPYELKRYIADQQRKASDGNHADYKPTYQTELDEIEKRCLKLYERGEAFLATISEDDKVRCRRFYMHKKKRVVFKYEQQELGEFYINRQSMLLPLYMGVIEEVQKLLEILK